MDDVSALPSATEVYAAPNGIDLRAAIFEPAASEESRRSGAVFFHGGGWKTGGPDQFYVWAQQLTAMGLVAICPEYRLVGKGAESVADCAEDALQAWRWVVRNAQRWNLDPERIIIGGGSAGGHLALITALGRPRPL